MNTSQIEKDWLRRIKGHAEEKVDKTETVVEKVKPKKAEQEESKIGHGFQDIAGMNELKQFVTEGFINVLKISPCRVYMTLRTKTHSPVAHSQKKINSTLKYVKAYMLGKKILNVSVLYPQFYELSEGEETLVLNSVSGMLWVYLV